jgi:hypothetical protein
MNEKMFSALRLRLYGTGIVTLAIWSLLLWNYFHGGVPSHHILARKDLPEISNWWGAVVLPLLTWFLLTRIQKRVVSAKDEQAPAAVAASFPMSIVYAFAGALLFGILLSVFFSLHYTDIPGYMLQGLFLLALFLPLYRAEYLLGFVIGMTYTFGAVLPTGIGSIIALICAVIYLFLRRAILFVVSKVVRAVS